MSTEHECACGNHTADDTTENSTCGCGGNCGCTPSAETVKQVAEHRAEQD